MPWKRQVSLPVFAVVTAALGLSSPDAAAQASPPPPPVPASSAQGDVKPLPAQQPPAASTASPQVDAKPPSSTPAFVSLTGPSQPDAPLAIARPTQRAASEPEPETLAIGDHPPAFRADFKLPFAVASLLSEEGASQAPFAPVPQLISGFQSGRMGLGLGLGFTHLAVSSSVTIDGDGSQSVTELLIAPTLTVDAFQSKDGKVALYFLGAPIFGIVLESNESAQSDLGFQFALGASYALHENFRLGMEVGPVGHFYSTDEGDTYSTVSLYTALVGSFVYPR
jgi:hypothetical protein